MRCRCAGRVVAVNTKARDEVLKVGLWLCLIEGWASHASAAARLHMAVEQVQSRLDWMQVRGFVEASAFPTGQDSTLWSYRWAARADFEALWAQVIPDRPCPVRLRTQPRSRTRKTVDSPK